MILQALEAYYRRKAADPESHIAPHGLEWKEIPFLLVLDEEGNFCGIEDTREGEGKRLRGKRFLVPKAVKRSSGINANLCWDSAEYVLGIPQKDPEKTKKKHEAFVRRFHEALGTRAEEFPFRAVARFLSGDTTQMIEKIRQTMDETLWKSFESSNVTFRVRGSEAETICESLRMLQEESDKAQEAEEVRSGEGEIDSGKTKKNEDASEGVCLVTGERASLARLHPSIKGVKGCQTSGGNIVSFNSDAFESYGKKQSYNAPVSETSAFAYTEALNRLLESNSENKLVMGETTVVFWAERPEAAEFPLEQNLPWLFLDPPEDDPDRGVRAVKALFDAVFTGRLSLAESTRFYLLGLAPNVSRIAIRFWRVGTVRDFASHLACHFKDMEIVRSAHDAEYWSLKKILGAVVLKGKLDENPPSLMGQVMTSALDGSCYPRTLLSRCVGRIRAEGGRVGAVRSGILKAYLNRHFRGKRKEEVSVSLDRNRPEVGYRLGRLFATLEKVQGDANPNVEATIRERYYGAASTSPVAVFSQLLRLKNHHLAKLKTPLRICREQEIGEILGGISAFPSHLSLEEQALFALGYYHQRQDFYTSKTATDEAKPATDETVDCGESSKNA